MDIFRGQNLLEFAERFKTDLDCKEYLGQINGRMVIVVVNVAIRAIRFARIFQEPGIDAVILKAQRPTLFIFHRVRFGVHTAFQNSLLDKNKRVSNL